MSVGPFHYIINILTHPLSSQSLSDRELTVLHAEVVALQKHYGLTYKDATYCLYNIKIQKMLVHDNAAYNLATLGWRLTAQNNSLHHQIKETDG